MQIAHFLLSHFAVDGSGNSFAKFVAGSYYELNDETRHQVLVGAAEIIDAPADYETAQEKADKAVAKAAAAQESADAAVALANASAAAEELATAPDSATSALSA
jgi:hypothetical protein